MTQIAGARMSGTHGPVLMFVHGVGSTAAIWDAQLQAFAGDHRCFAVELRGNGAGKPDPDPAQITREGFARDVLTVADAAQAASFHLIGCSLGGVVAFELARLAPQRVASMVLVGSFAAYDDGDAYAATVIEQARAAGSMQVFAAQRAEKLAMPPGRRRDETIAQMACKSVDCYAASTIATWTGDYRAQLAQIRVPALVCRGERDPVAPARYAEEIARGIPGARLETIEGAGHVANADAPERFNALLRDFLQPVTRSNPA